VKSGRAVDADGARDQGMRVFLHRIDHETEPRAARAPMRFTEVYISHVVEADFRENARADPGTRTATLDRAGIQKPRANWVYLAGD
jgi:hypothetical protein